METLYLGRLVRVRIRVLDGAHGRLIVYPGSVWRAQVRVGSGRCGIRVPSGSRVRGVCKKVFSYPVCS